MRVRTKTRVGHNHHRERTLEVSQTTPIAIVAVECESWTDLAVPG